MIDLHCHILPKIDDGSKSIKQSLEMAQVFEQAGYQQVAATPHTVPGTRWMPSPAAIRERVAELNQAIRDKSIQLTVLPGAEIALFPQVPDLLDDGMIQSLADTSYVLIEPPFQRLPLGWQQVFFELKSKGYTPLLAHAERCEQLADKPELFEELLSREIYLQVNWGSFWGHHGSKAKKTAVYLATKGYIHCLATDSHRPDQHLVDSFELAAAEVEELVGTKNLDLLARGNPLRVLRGEPLIEMDKDEIRPEVKRRRRWGIL
jgi:protein-tyrosine phosphatase